VVFRQTLPIKHVGPGSGRMHDVPGVVMCDKFLYITCIFTYFRESRKRSEWRNLL